jgi:Tfp pilus assembly protein PilZ
MQGWRKNMEDAKICDLSITVKDKNMLYLEFLMVMEVLN